METCPRPPFPHSSHWASPHGATALALPPLRQRSPGPILQSWFSHLLAAELADCHSSPPWGADVVGSRAIPVSHPTGHWTGSEPRPGPVQHSPSPWNLGLRSLVSQLPVLHLEGHESQGLWLPRGAWSLEATSNESHMWETRSADKLRRAARQPAGEG